ncbi:MAG: TIGR03560 family F420-dependent LLM class oxidoreductase [Candidatus Bathyarchaeota archaeon]|nr:MAG: TIGR03560 family F420-dependent LLM class oxidoreductase [Candidatus Bathyarchaeota archaeon]
MAQDVWFGVHVPPEGRNFEEMKYICQKVEQSGFDLLTVTDHLMNMRNPNGVGNHPLECWTTLAGLAAVTKTIRLGPLVSCYGYRRPTILAKMATTVDIISKGRLVFGIGAGWHEAEFNGFMGRFPSVRERLQGLHETIKICKQMFTTERSTHHGSLYHVENVLNSPQPTQRPVPVMVGGGGERVTLKIAAQYADISHFFTGNLTALDHKLAVLKNHCKTVNRKYSEIRKATSMGLILGETEIAAEQKLKQRATASGMTLDETRTRAGAGYGTPDMVTKNIQEYVNRGVGLITFRFTGFDNLRLFAREVLPHFK